MRWMRRLGLAAILAVALAVVPWRVYKSEGFVKHRRLSDEAAHLREGNEQLRLRNRALRREIDRLRNDLDAVGAVARDELGLVGEGEIVFRIDAPAGGAK